MKKFVLLATLTLGLSTGAKAYNELLSCSFVGAYSHTDSPSIQCGAFGMYFSYRDVYFGVILNPADKSSSMGVDVWDDQWMIYTYHIGYRLRLKKSNFGVTPLVGLTYAAEGYIDGSDYSFNNDGTVVNQFYYTKRGTYFDAGAIIDYSTPRKDGFGWKFFVSATLHNLSAGIGFYM